MKKIFAILALGLVLVLSGCVEEPKDCTDGRCYVAANPIPPSNEVGEKTEPEDICAFKVDGYVFKRDEEYRTFSDVFERPTSIDNCLENPIYHYTVGSCYQLEAFSIENDIKYECIDFSFHSGYEFVCMNHTEKFKRGKIIDIEAPRIASDATRGSCIRERYEVRNSFLGGRAFSCIIDKIDQSTVSCEFVGSYEDFIAR